MNVETGQNPSARANGYPTQRGFLWTNASYVWALTHVLGYELQFLSGR